MYDNYDEAYQVLQEDKIFLKENYESTLKEIDEYWDKENQYIKNSGIYTKEEVRQILESHEEMRRIKKEEARENYKADLEMLEIERDHIELDREL